MKMSANGIRFLKDREGVELKAYPDPATNGEPYTIGVGHTSMAGPPKVTKGMTITEHEAEEILTRDLVKYEKAVEDHAGPEFSQNQFDAMVSFCFNIGPGNFKSSSVARHHKARNYHAAAESFLKWNKAAGKVMKGLTDRRKLEKELYEKADKVA